MKHFNLIQKSDFSRMQFYTFTDGEHKYNRRKLALKKDLTRVEFFGVFRS